VAKSDQESKRKADPHSTYTDQKRKHFKLFDLILADLNAEEKTEGISRMPIAFTALSFMTKAGWLSSS
jgi:hypothetical protein